MDRAYSVFEIRTVDEERRIIEGVATTPSTDRIGDIVEPLGAQFKLPLPFLWQHDRKSPIGTVIKADVTAGGIRATIQLAQDDVPGPLKDLLDLAWRSIKKGLVRGLSIGFKPLETADINGSWGQRFIKWDWLELSAVTIPANMEASILNIKTLAGQPPAVFGTAAPKSPSVLGPKHSTIRGSTMNAQQRILDLENAKDAKVLRMSQINDTVANDGRTKDAEERAEFDKLAADLAGIESELTDARILEAAQGAAATAVVAKDTATGSRARAEVTRIKATANRPAGHGFACIIQAMASAKMAGMNPVDLARRQWPDWPEIAKEIEGMQYKAAVVAGTSTTTGWAAELAPIQPLTDEFVAILRPQTLLGRIPGLTRVPFNSRVPIHSSAGTAHWVGQGLSKPVTAQVFTSADFPVYKMSKICVLTKELVALSNPGALPLVQREMVNQLIEFADTQLMLSTVAISSTVNPAAITNGVTGTVTSGTAEANIRQDLRVLLNSFSANGYPLSEVVLVTSEDILFRIASSVNTLGMPSFPGLGITGGTVYNVPMIGSNSVTEEHLIGLHAPSVLVGPDGGMEISVSEEASLQMDDAPTSPPTSVTVFQSLWQENKIGIRVEQFAGWLKARSTAVNRIHTIAYV